VIIFCPNDGGPGQLICPGWGLTVVFRPRVEGSEKCRPPP